MDQTDSSVHNHEYLQLLERSKFLEEGERRSLEQTSSLISKVALQEAELSHMKQQVSSLDTKNKTLESTLQLKDTYYQQLLTKEQEKQHEVTQRMEATYNAMQKELVVLKTKEYTLQHEKRNLARDQQGSNVKVLMLENSSVELQKTIDTWKTAFDKATIQQEAFHALTSRMHKSIQEYTERYTHYETEQQRKQEIIDTMQTNRTQQDTPKTNTNKENDPTSNITSI